MNATDFIVFNKPDLGEEEIEAVSNVIRSGWIGTGKVASQFEEEFADFIGSGYAVAVGSCSVGLQLALKASNIPRGFEVLTTPLTFAATLNAVLAVGLDVRFVDTTEQGNISIQKLNHEIDGLTRAVIPVHFSGLPCDLNRLKTNYLNKKITVIEDCAHAFGSLLGNKGDFKVFSFYANKNITSGEGGIVLCKDKKLADEVRVLSAQGLSTGAWGRYSSGPIKRYSVEKIGLKGNMPDILAAIGLAQLRRWPEMRQKRAKVWRIYEKAFGSLGVGHSMHFYPLLVPHGRDFVREKLYKHGIGTGIHYKPLHLEPAYKFLGYTKGDFPNSEFWGENELSLPVSSTMGEEDALRIVEIVAKELKCN